MVYPDPAVRESLLRYVREGGGIAGNHAVTYANNNWPEYTELMGAWAGRTILKSRCSRWTIRIIC